MEREAMDPRVAVLIEDYQRRTLAGETPRADEYRERAGDTYTEFLSGLETRTTFGVKAEPEPEEVLPREFGDYRLLRVLGRGAMGVVYDAVDLRLDRIVALKVLRGGFDADSPAMARFEREARACAQVRHDRIVEIYEAGQVEGRPFYSMTRVEGEPLSDLIREGRLPDREKVVRGLSGIADALHALHLAGIVHRDVKPSNIIAEPDGRMVLADFGLARTAASGDLTQTGEALGTPLYMSPEQVLGKREEVDGRTDVYGLGATMYETLLGRPVLEADDTRGMLRQILTERPKRPRDLDPAIERSYEAVVMKALEKRREDRYASAAAMRDDLLALSEGRPVAGRPVSSLRRFARRWRVPAIAAASLLVLVAWAALSFANRPAVLEVLSHPPATVWIDGERAGRTPVRRELPAGEHDILMRLPGFREHRQIVDLAAGSHRTFERVLVAEDPEDPVALARLAEAFQVKYAPPRRRSGTQLGSRRPAVQALLPRGDLRPEDLDVVCVSTGDAFRGKGTLEIRRGAEVLFRTEVDPEAGETDIEVPEDVREALKEGDDVTWGFYPEEGEPAVAQCRVVSEDIDDRVAEIEEFLSEQHPRVRAHLRAQLFLKHGLDYAAFKEARRISKEADRSANALHVMKLALSSMDLERSAAWDTVTEKLSEVPPEQRARLLEAQRATGD